MKKTYFLLFTLTILLLEFVNATVWRVNNRPNVNADFTTLQTAIDGASHGDTLYIEASETSYGNGTFTKKLIVIGAGYWLNENDTTQMYKEESKIAKLTFNEGSQGSKIMGLSIYYANSNSPSVITINTDSISIERNNITSNAYGHGSSGYSLSIGGNRNNIEFKQNWIYAYGGNNNGSSFCIYIDGILTNSIITNNFLRSTKGSKYAIYMSTNSTATELIIDNNVMWGNIITYYTIHNDNILVDGTYNNGAGDLTSNNICNATQYPAVNSNQQNIDMNTVFVDYDLYIDNGYILKAGSPAIGAGLNGGDCGAFSNDVGHEPYMLSGIPPIPSVFEATVTTVGVSSLPVNIKASTHN